MVSRGGQFPITGIPVIRAAAALPYLRPLDFFFAGIGFSWFNVRCTMCSHRVSVECRFASHRGEQFLATIRFFNPTPSTRRSSQDPMTKLTAWRVSPNRKLVSEVALVCDFGINLFSPKKVHHGWHIHKSSRRRVRLCLPAHGLFSFPPLDTPLPKSVLGKRKTSSQWQIS